MRTIQIEIKNEKRSAYQLYNWVAVFFSVAAFGLFLFNPSLFIGALAALILIGVYLLMRYYAKRKRRSAFFFDEKGYFYFLTGFLFLGVQMYIPAAISVLFGIVYYPAMQNIMFLFNKEGITRKNFPSRHWGWDDVQHVILKDAVLTIDLKNNRIIQREILSSQSVNEADFNTFVNACLHQSNEIAYSESGLR